MATLAPDAVRDDVLRLAHGGLGFDEFATRVTRALNRAVPFDGVAVVACDPATSLPTDKWVQNSITGSAGSRLAEIELREPDVNKFNELALTPRRARSLSEATGGKLDRSPRHRELLRPRGFGDELRVACVRGLGMWGLIVMHRDLDQPDFAAREVKLLASLSNSLAEAFQRVNLEGRLSPDVTSPRDSAPGLLLLDEEDRIEMANEAGGGWLDELREDGRDLPLVVTEVARRARAVAAGQRDGMATARVRTASGRWAVVRGSVLRNESRTRSAITVEAARLPQLAALIVDAYDLTEQERRVTELVARGLPTAAIAHQLHLSAFTVQDHLKAVFSKLDVSSRGELVAKLFVDHYYVDGGLRDPRG
jgi:DNA-binding NarL/FixJ family response regulator